MAADDADSTRGVTSATATVAAAALRLSQYTRPRLEALAAAAAAQSRRAAALTAEASRRGVEATSAGARRGAAEGAVLARRGMAEFLRLARELGPVMQEYGNRALGVLKHSEALQLRRLDDQPSFTASLSSIFGGSLDALMAELRLMPSPAVAAAVVVALRSMATLSAVGDSVVYELLHGRSFVSRVVLTTTAAPGMILLCHYRSALLEGVLLPWTAGGVGDPQAGRPQWHAQLARNLRRMPPVFWLATSASGAIWLQVVKESSMFVVYRVLRMRLRLLLAITAMYVAAMHGGKERAAGAVSGCVERLPPDVARALTCGWYQCQVGARKATAALLALAASSQRSGGDGGGAALARRPGRVPSNATSMGNSEDFAEARAPVFGGPCPASSGAAAAAPAGARGGHPCVG